MNCVLTHESTVTRSLSMSRIMPSTEKRLMTTHGAPRMVGVKWPVQRPNPNGAGTTDMNDVVVGERTEVLGLAVEVEPAVLELHHALGQPRRARGGVEQEQLVGIESPLCHAVDEARDRCGADLIAPTTATAAVEAGPCTTT